jgi:hypothetical protein
MNAESLSRIPVKIRVEGLGEAEGELVKFMAPKTVEALAGNPPLIGKASLWRGEVYFSTPIRIGFEKPRAKVTAGSLAYWPQGSAFCVFYENAKPYSPVNLVGKLKSGVEIFRRVKLGMVIRVEKA